MWRYVGDGEGYPGLPYGDMTDDEMKVAAAEYEPRFKESHGAIKDCGLWVQEKTKPVLPDTEQEA